MSETKLLGTWNERDTFEAQDGRRFSIFSEHVRGEPRFYYAAEEIDKGPQDGCWHTAHLPFDGSHDKRLVRRRIMRYVKETSDG